MSRIKLSGWLFLAFVVGAWFVFQQWSDWTPQDEIQRNHPLSYAAYQGNVAHVRLLLQQKHSARETDPDRNTPLHWAARGINMREEAGADHAAVVRELLSHGADPNAVNSSIETPLLRAGWNPEMVRLLLDAGAEVNGDYRTRMAPLHGMVTLGKMLCDEHAQSVRLVLARGADPNQGTNPANAPLLSAAMMSCPPVVEALLQGGANPDIELAQGRRIEDAVESFEKSMNSSVLLRDATANSMRAENMKLLQRYRETRAKAVAESVR